LPSTISSPISFLFSFGSRVPAARFWLAGRGRISLDWISCQGGWVYWAGKTQILLCSFFVSV
jgi:hypothetical protein